jgi:two-component system alkaline phosphatase synthesis response regulator PhoP
MSPTILIVDDCTDIVRIIARYLESASYHTVTATNGLEARRVLERMTPDCIILDLMMPGMSGAELLHGLRSDPATAGIPVVLVSARVGHYGTHFGAQLDADFSVGKPFTRQQIVQAVQTVLAGKGGAALASPNPSPPSASARTAQFLGR